jgi:peptide methionine sulfoxide reductase MsrA
MPEELQNPSYEQVGSNTGHAEAIAVYYDPKVISFKELVNVFSRHKTNSQSTRARSWFFLSLYCLYKKCSREENY